MGHAPWAQRGAFGWRVRALYFLANRYYALWFRDELSCTRAPRGLRCHAKYLPAMAKIALFARLRLRDLSSYRGRNYFGGTQGSPLALHRRSHSQSTHLAALCRALLYLANEVYQLLDDLFYYPCSRDFPIRQVGRCTFISQRQTNRRAAQQYRPHPTTIISLLGESQCSCRITWSPSTRHRRHR
ncbi:hypothetical protein NEOLEDRAFT_625472 [Neolentinus lepideus HHB14362 ss-1]|uniref:Uncharacterized protein n=1 Tax=Neolentinus lepideus HHB14362 ss-1 TaxID=1314782 RepID=A0A165QPU5_9AGAM|nr:hypothetical protein NEOLEDRAFT_625472 [Neolentinus lepideus HHB14362 ss-1]